MEWESAAGGGGRIIGTAPHARVRSYKRAAASRKRLMARWRELNRLFCRLLHLYLSHAAARALHHRLRGVPLFRIICRKYKRIALCCDICAEIA